MRRKTSLILSVSLGLVTLLVVGALIGLPIWMRSILHSAAFRQLVDAKTGQALHAKATYSPLSWQGSSAFADSLQVEGSPASFVKNFQANQIRAEMNWRAAWDGVWQIDRVDVVHFVGEFGPQNDSTLETPSVRTGKLPALLPQNFKLGELNLAQSKLTFLAGKDGFPMVLNDARLTLKPVGAGWTIDGSGGTFALPVLPEMEVVTFRSRLQESVFFLTEANLRLGENGTLSATGEFAEKSQLKIQWTHLDAATFLDEEWRTRLSGRFDGTAKCAWPGAGPAHGTATGTFQVTEGMLQNIPLLDKVADFTGARQFRHMPIQEFSGAYSWSAGTLTFTDLILESKGLMRVEGRCELAADGTLAGTLRVGVTPQTLQWLPGSRERVFTVAENGYLWTPVRLAGTWENPQEDLSARLAAAMKDEVINQGRKVIDALPGPAKEGAQGILDALMPLLK